DPDPVAIADPHRFEGVGEGVGPPLQALEAERAALVDQGDLVRVVDRRGGDSGCRRGAPAQEGGTDLQRLVRAQRLDDAGTVQDLQLEGRVGGGCPQLRGPVAENPHRCEDYSLCTEATAMQAMPSPRPIQPMPSLLVALTLTRAEVA